jgi:hypothetical protein
MKGSEATSAQHNSFGLDTQLIPRLPDAGNKKGN